MMKGKCFYLVVVCKEIQGLKSFQVGIVDLLGLQEA